MSQPTQTISIQQAVQITNDVICHMIRLFETANDPNGHKIANDEVILGLKHTRLLLSPFIILQSRSVAKAQAPVLASSPADPPLVIPSRK